jgi:hypothetical protein
MKGDTEGIDPGAACDQFLCVVIVGHHKVGTEIDVLLLRIANATAQGIGEQYELLVGLLEAKSARHSSAPAANDDRF